MSVQKAVLKRAADSTPQRFQAQIGKQGPNPYVDVPEGVSLAFGHHAQGGRISVQGSLNEVSVRATLVPVGRGRHRLYVNGGMRAAAGVSVGDTVSFELWSTAHANVSVPEDLEDALGEVDGAREAFEAMSPSHRRELIRYVDDARTPSTRERRIGRTIDHALGRPPADRKPSGRPMWTCPECGTGSSTRTSTTHARGITSPTLSRGRPIRSEVCSTGSGQWLRPRARSS